MPEAKVVDGTLKHDGEEYPEGSTLELPEGTIETLRAVEPVGAVSEDPDDNGDAEESAESEEAETVEQVDATDAALDLMAENGVDPQDVDGTGENGRIKKPDVEEHIEG